MILTHDELHPHELLPEAEDNAVAARNSTLFCWVAGLWFFVSPWTFFGVSEQPDAWNCWLVGAAVVLLTMVRLTAPLITRALSWPITVLGVWVLISPWIFGYSGDGARLASSIGVGAVLVGFSLMSRLISTYE